MFEITSYRFKFLSVLSKIVNTGHSDFNMARLRVQYLKTKGNKHTIKHSVKSYNLMSSFTPKIIWPPIDYQSSSISLSKISVSLFIPTSSSNQAQQKHDIYKQYYFLSQILKRIY